MAKEVRIELTEAQKAKIKAATGKTLSEIRVSSLGKNLAVNAKSLRSTNTRAGSTTLRSSTPRAGGSTTLRSSTPRAGGSTTLRSSTPRAGSSTTLRS
jgi:hypothetical protein